MKNKKPLIRKALKKAMVDMKPEVQKLRLETPNQRYYDWTDGDGYMSGTDTYVVPLSALDNVEVREMNKALGLDTTDGINQWYKQ